MARYKSQMDIINQYNRIYEVRGKRIRDRRVMLALTQPWQQSVSVTPANSV